MNDSLISAFRSKWNGPSFWSPTLGKQGGTVILVRENSDFEINKWQRSSGCIVSILASLGELNFNLVSIYAPTNSTGRKCFYENLHDFFFPNALKIIAGDFNCVEAVSDKNGGIFSHAKDLTDFRMQFRLIDIWPPTFAASVTTRRALETSSEAYALPNLPHWTGTSPGKW